MNKKNYFIEFNRFIAILIIMGHHLSRVKAVDYHFATGWVYVEFFFLVTGYFTARHLCRYPEENCIDYTLAKFKRLIGIAWLAIVSEYMLELSITFIVDKNRGLPVLLSYLKDLPFEMMMIGSSYKTPSLVPVWYLSALFIVFPLFCLFYQIKNKQLRHTLEVLIPLVYYGYAGIYDNWRFPLNLIRAFSCLLLGAFIFDFGRKIIAVLHRRFSEAGYTALQLICLIIPVLACWYNTVEYHRVVVLCFMIVMTITAGDRGIKLKHGIFGLLGEITMPIYLFHWVVAMFIGAYLEALGQNLRILIYYSTSILLGIMIVMVKKKIKKHSS